MVDLLLDFRKDERMVANFAKVHDRVAETSNTTIHLTKTSNKLLETHMVD
jgi:hypothetical protein